MVFDVVVFKTDSVIGPVKLPTEPQGANLKRTSSILLSQWVPAGQSSQTRQFDFSEQDVAMLIDLL